MRNEKGQFVKGTKPKNGFKKGLIPWSLKVKGLGILKANKTSFKKGQVAPMKGKKRTDVPYNKGQHIQSNTGRTHFKKGHKLHLGRHWKMKDSSKMGRSEQLTGKKRLDMTGEKHPLWNGGSSFFPYPVDWTETLKKSIKERDRYVCKICGSSPEMLHVHHIDYDKENCNPTNLISLCNPCHSKTNFNRDHWIDYFRNLNLTI
jgi:hypothetical protein